jgi:hypothetical protein
MAVTLQGPNSGYMRGGLADPVGLRDAFSVEPLLTPVSVMALRAGVRSHRRVSARALGMPRT